MATTTTTFTTNPANANYLVPTTFTVHVAASDSSLPTGNVVFSDGANGLGPVLATIPVDGSGNATFISSNAPLTALYFGLHEIRADYQGDSTRGTSFSFVPFFVNPGLQRRYFAVTKSLKLYELDVVAQTASLVDEGLNGGGVGSLSAIGVETGILNDVPQFATDPTTGNFHLSDGVNNWLFDGTTWVREGFRIPQSSPGLVLGSSGSSTLTVNENRFYWSNFADETIGRTHDSDTGMISAGTGPINTVTVGDLLKGVGSPVAPNNSGWEFVAGAWRTHPPGVPPEPTSPIAGIGFGAALALTDTVAGIVVEFPSTFQQNAPGSTCVVSFVQLAYQGALIGVAKNPNSSVTQQASDTVVGSTTDLWGTQAPITQFSITGNVVTFLAVNSYHAGQQVKISGLSHGTYLNGQLLTVNAGGLSGSQFTANFTHTDVGATTDAGFADFLTPTVVNDSTFGYQVQYTSDINNRIFFGAGGPPELQIASRTNQLNAVTVYQCQGTITTSNASPNVIGSVTQFTKSAVVGDILYKDGAVLGTIASITSDNALVLQANATSTNTGIHYNIAPPRATHWHLWASEADASQVGMYLASIPITTTSYVDTSPFLGDPGALFLQIERPVRNDPPVGSRILEIHKRRLWRRQDSRLNYYTFSAAEEVQALGNGSPVESNPGVDVNTQSPIINEDSYPDQSRIIRALTSHADSLYIASETQVVPLFGQTIDDFGVSQVAAFAIGGSGRWSMISTPHGLCFVSYDKKVYLYPTSNYPWAYVPKDVNVTEQLIEIGKPLRTVLATIKSSDLDNVRLQYYNYQIRNWLVLCFQDNTNNYQTWVYEFDTKTWTQMQRGFTSVAVFEVTAGNKVLVGGAPDGNIYVIDDLTGTYSNPGANPATTWRMALIDFGDPDHKHVPTYIEIELTNAALAADLTVNFYLDPVDADNPTASVPTRNIQMYPVAGANLYRGFFTSDGGGSLCQRMLVEILLASSTNVGGFRGVKLVSDQASALVGSIGSALGGGNSGGNFT